MVAAGYNDPVAVATFVVAGATAVLAWATWRAAKAAQTSAEAGLQEVKVTEEATKATLRAAVASEEQTAATRGVLEASIKPILVDIPLRQSEPRVEVQFDDGPTVRQVDLSMILVPEENERFAYFSAPLRNIGPGVAFIRGLGLEFPGGTGWSGKMSAAVVAPGETTRVSFSIPKDRPELAEGLGQLRVGSVSVAVSYTDVHGGQTTITRLLVSTLKGPGWRVRQVSLSRPGETEPFAMSGPADG